MKIRDYNGNELWADDLPTIRKSLEAAVKAGASLDRASIIGASLKGASLPHIQICPEVGSFSAFKKLANGQIAELLIPGDAKRNSCLVGRKCRSDMARVISGEGDSMTTQFPKRHYAPGELVVADNYDPDIRVECSGGIHWFITRQEAEEFTM